MTAKVVVFHPGTQHSYQTALAFQKASTLAWYATEIFYQSDRLPYNLMGLLPSNLHGRLVKEFARRYHPDINPQLIRTFGYWEWIERISMRLGLRRVEHYANEFGNLTFGRKIGSLVLRDKVAGVWGFDTSSLETFKIVKGHGIRCVLEQTIAHPRVWNRILTEERELVGEAFDPYPRPYPETDLRRVDAEIGLADQIVCGSGFAKQTMVSEGVDARKISVISYGVDVNRFAPGAKNRSSDRLRLLFVGHFGLRKGAWYLLEAMKLLRHLRGITLTIVGKQTVPQQYFSELSDQLQFVSHVPHSQMHALYREADIFVMPSLYEGSAISVNEALSAGLPVITTPNSGSVIEDGIEGFIVPIRDAKALASKIESLYEDPDRRIAMGEQARRRAMKLTWDRYGQGIVDLWEQMTNSSAVAVQMQTH